MGEIQKTLVSPGVDFIHPSLTKELLLLVPFFHFGACFVRVATTAGWNEIVSVAVARTEPWYNVVQGCGIISAVATLTVPGFVDGLSLTFFC